MPGDARAGESSSRRPCPETIREAGIFREVYRTGRRYRGSEIRVVYRKNALGRIRLGFSVSRKTGNAVERNRFKRRIRTLARSEGWGLELDMIFSPAGALGSTTWQGMRREFLEVAAAGERD